LLDINTRNRTVTNGRVMRLVQALIDNRWVLINNGIGIDTKGDLVDGQHRLHAVVVANLPAEFYVTVGLKPESREVIDTGKARTGADALAIAGFGRGRGNEAAAMAIIHRYENGLLMPYGGNSDKRFLPHDMLIDIAASIDRAKLDWSSHAAQQTARVITGINRSAMTSLLYLAHCKDSADASMFADRLKTGEHLRSGDPELTLRNAAPRWKTAGQATHPNDWHFCVYVKAWNARRANKAIRVLRQDRDDGIPEIK
jgi:hypothetical protein